MSLIQFLVNNGIEDFDSRIIGEIREDEPENWIENAFDWHKQSEGYEFWSRLDVLWREICEEQEVKYVF
jgi:hypothetical protein